MIAFKNKGLIDMQAVTTFGISAKEGDSPIGYFGTGLKYAIAIALRSNQKIVLHRGLKRYDFTVKTGSMRGKDFEFIHMNSKKLPFTTELGKNWSLENAFRELYCNAKDEGGDCYVGAGPEAGYTTITVAGTDFDAVYKNRGQFILDSKPDLELGEVSVRRGPGSGLFYKGIKVNDLPTSLYTYELTGDQTLTEDRTLKYDWHGRQTIVRSILGSDDADFIEAVITSGQDKWESEMDFDTGDMPSETFLAVCEKYRFNHSVTVNQSAIEAYLQHSGVERHQNISDDLDEIQQIQLRKAINFLKLIGYDIDQYPITVVASLGEGVHGLAQDGKIYISAHCFDTGTKYLASTILEEFLHLDTGYCDCSRNMQTFLFDTIIGMGERYVLRDAL